MRNTKEIGEGIFVFALSLLLSVLFALVSHVHYAWPLARFLGVGPGREAPTVLALSLAAVALRRGPWCAPGGAVANMRVLVLAAYLRAMLSAVLSAVECDAGGLLCEVLGVI